MNILHLKYAVEIAKARSINKASEVLLIAQPNLSRSLKELESDLGITIFDRSAKGMTLTAEGEGFIAHAQKILEQIEEVENIYRSGMGVRRKISFTSFGANYISSAISEFSKESEPKGVIRLVYREAPSAQTVAQVLASETKLGIVRCFAENEEQIKDLLFDKGLEAERLASFEGRVLVSTDSPLAKCGEISMAMLDGCAEVVNGDFLSVENSQLELYRREAKGEDKIYVGERASGWELISDNPNMYMWIYDFSDRVLNAYSLAVKKVTGINRVCCDLIVYKKNYRYTESEKGFLGMLRKNAEKLS